jgi:hypothetical protein
MEVNRFSEGSCFWVDNLRNKRAYTIHAVGANQQLMSALPCSQDPYSISMRVPNETPTVNILPNQLLVGPLQEYGYPSWVVVGFAYSTTYCAHRHDVVISGELMTTKNSHYRARFISSRSIRRVSIHTFISFERCFRLLANGYFGSSIPL